MQKDSSITKTTCKIITGTSKIQKEKATTEMSMLRTSEKSIHPDYTPLKITTMIKMKRTKLTNPISMNKSTRKEETSILVDNFTIYDL